jgi:hypothetical protein
MTTLYRIVLVCVSLSLVCGSALARESRPRHGTHGPSGQRSEPSSSRKAKASVVQRAKLAIDTMSLRSNRVHRQLRDARARKQTARTRCLDGMLSQIHAVERQARLQLGALHATASHLDRGRLKRLRTLSTRSQQLVVEASRCGKPYSSRQRVKTSYTVRVLAPKLPRPKGPADVARNPHRG